MISNRPCVWFITGAASPLGYRLCLAALARGDRVVASASFQKEVDRMCAVGAYGIKMDCEMSFGQVRDRIRDAVSYNGRIDFLIHIPEVAPRRDLGPYCLPSAYDTNTFSYAAIQITKAVSQVSAIRQIAVIVPNVKPGHTWQDFNDLDATTDNVEATAQLLASGYRSKHVRVLLVKPGSILRLSESRYTADDPRIAVERIVAQMTEGGSSEPGIRVL